MSVRRLDPVQPATFAFTPENVAWAKQLVSRYPAGKQASAVIPLLWRAQEQAGWTSRLAIERVAEMLDMAYIRVLEVATFYTMFQLSPVGTKAHIQVCGTIACQLRGAEDLRNVCERKIHPQPHHVNADGTLSWEEVECLGSCVNAPMIQVFKDTYEDLTPATLEVLIDDWQAGNKTRSGPQISRQFSAPEGGATTLTDKSLFKGQRRFDRVEAPPPPPPSPAAPAAAAVAPAPAIKEPIPSPSAVKPALADIRPVTAVSKQVEIQKQIANDREALSPAPGVVVTEKAQAETGIVRVTQDEVLKSTSKVPAKPRSGRIDPPKPVVRSAARPIDGRPELLKKPNGKADDLKLIWGVGPGLEKLLNKLGVWHFEQIASWSARELAWVDDKLEGFKGRAQRDEWVQQSRKLETGWRPGPTVGQKPGKK